MALPATHNRHLYFYCLRTDCEKLWHIDFARCLLLLNTARFNSHIYLRQSWWVHSFIHSFVRVDPHRLLSAYLLLWTVYKLITSKWAYSCLSALKLKRQRDNIYQIPINPQFKRLLRSHLIHFTILYVVSSIIFTLLHICVYYPTIIMQSSWLKMILHWLKKGILG